MACSQPGRPETNSARRAVAPFLFLVAVTLAGCDSSTDVPQPTSLLVLPGTAVIRALGETTGLNATLLDQRGAPIHGAAISWNSSDESIATVNGSGRVRAVGSGTATITASYAGIAGSADVAVDPWIDLDANRHTCAISARGFLFCWGFGYGLQPVAVAPTVRFASVSAGRHSTCASARDGSTYCWGTNQWGQLGTGSTEPRGEPARAVNAWHANAVVTNSPVGIVGAHACGLTTTRTAFCWGAGNFHQLGTGSAVGLESCEYSTGPGACSTVPVPVAGAHQFIALSAGSSYSCGITDNGSVYCWGTGVGGPGATISEVPQLLASGLHLVSISSKMEHTCAVATNGWAYCWGSGVSGKLGTGYTGTTIEPMILGLGSWKQVSASTSHTCGVRTDGSALCWGTNMDGQLGVTGTTGSLVPVAVEGGHRFTVVTAGVSHSCGVTVDGAIYCWGAGGYLGTGNAQRSSVPVRITDPAGAG
jgi:hypothetical protein